MGLLLSLALSLGSLGSHQMATGNFVVHEQQTYRRLPSLPPPRFHSFLFFYSRAPHFFFGFPSHVFFFILSIPHN